MAKIIEREKALSLRKQGWSIGDIAKELLVSKSTVSGWCRDVVLSTKAIRRLELQSKNKNTRALLQYSARKRQLREIETARSAQIGKETLGKLTKRDVYCIGLGLYWGEGYKQGNQEFGFTNSDPHMIRFYLRWLKVVFNVEKTDLILRVSINQLHAHRINVVEQFWSDITGVDKSQFTKSSLIKTNAKKIYQHTDNHMGTLRVKVRKGASMRREIIGAIASIDI